MRARRFEEFMKGLVEAHPTPAIVSVQTFVEAGDTPMPGGLRFAFPSGGTAYLQFVHGSPKGGTDLTAEETIVEGQPPAPIEIPELAVQSGRVSMRALEQWLKALVLTSGSRELASIVAYSDRTGVEGMHPYGLTVTWHNGGQAFAHLAHTLPAGQQPRFAERWRILEAV